MKKEEINFLLHFYEGERIPFYYFKDKYVLQLLSYFIEEEISISTLKKSDFGFLLNKPISKSIIAQSGNSLLNQNQLNPYSHQNTLPFNISITKWGKYKKHRKEIYYQTTRPGYSLVIQLNFSHHHDNAYYKLVQPEKKKFVHPFRYTCHPVAENNTLTMAWARLDIDLETGEILIEEIQNDWLRCVSDIYKYLSKTVKKDKKRAKNHWLFRYADCSLESFMKYAKVHLMPYQKIWDEAILSAAIWFAKEEIGIHDIYFHTYKSGSLLKDCCPPRSLYTSLPKRFGFKRQEEAPLFIKNCAYLKKTLRRNKLNWWYLNL